jgi:hypothetical protein
MVFAQGWRNRRIPETYTYTCGNLIQGKDNTVNQWENMNYLLTGSETTSYP